MLIDEFELVHLIGSGSYGRVYKAVHKTTGKVCAIKIIHTDLPIQYDDPNNNSQFQIQKILKEIDFMIACQNQHIVKCFGSELNQNGICMFLEYCEGGSVKDILRFGKTRLSQYHIASILEGILKGLDYIHSRKLIHRDIKAGNILINEVGQVKLADFGVSTEVMHTMAAKDTVVGSPFWMSPQILSKNKYNFKTDIWSLGITAIEFAEGEPPYSHIHPIRAMFAIQNNPPQSLSDPHLWSKEFNDFVSKCLIFDPMHRPSARDLLNHAFIRSKSRGSDILEEIVKNALPELEDKRKSTGQSDQRSLDTVMNQNGTMIEHHGKQHYEPFWESEEHAQKPQVEEQDQIQNTDMGTMVEKPVKEAKESDFMLFYKQQEQSRDIFSQTSKEQPVKSNNLAPKTPPSTPLRLSAQAQRVLEDLDQQMWRDIEKIKQKYQKEKEQYLESLKRKDPIITSKRLSDNNSCSISKIKAIIDESKQSAPKSSIKRPEPSNSSTSSSNHYHMVKPQKGKQYGGVKDRSFGLSSTHQNPLSLKNNVSKTNNNLQKTQEIQTFEEALMQLKQNISSAEDGSYFTSFLKKVKKTQGVEPPKTKTFGKRL